MTRRVCVIPDCGELVKARGWCSRHYMRFRKHGDPLTNLRPELGLAQRFYREVVLTDDSGVDDPCLIWPYARTGNGYAELGRSIVSRLVCKEEYGPPPTPRHEAAHSCGNGHLRCVTKSHLSWKTPKENAADKLIHGTSNRGERQGNSRLKEPEVREILALKGKLLQREIGERFNVPQGHISRIHRRQCWGWLT